MKDLISLSECLLFAGIIVLDWHDLSTMRGAFVAVLAAMIPKITATKDKQTTAMRSVVFWEVAADHAVVNFISLKLLKEIELIELRLIDSFEFRQTQLCVLPATCQLDFLKRSMVSEGDNFARGCLASRVMQRLMQLHHEFFSADAKMWRG